MAGHKDIELGPTFFCVKLERAVSRILSKFTFTVGTTTKLSETKIIGKHIKRSINNC